MTNNEIQCYIRDKMYDFSNYCTRRLERIFYYICLMTILSKPLKQSTITIINTIEEHLIDVTLVYDAKVLLI